MNELKVYTLTSLTRDTCLVLSQHSNSELDALKSWEIRLPTPPPLVDALAASVSVGILIGQLLQYYSQLWSSLVRSSC